MADYRRVRCPLCGHLHDPDGRIFDQNPPFTEIVAQENKGGQGEGWGPVRTVVEGRDLPDDQIDAMTEKCHEVLEYFDPDVLEPQSNEDHMGVDEAEALSEEASAAKEIAKAAKREAELAIDALAVSGVDLDWVAQSLHRFDREFEEEMWEAILTDVEKRQKELGVHRAEVELIDTVLQAGPIPPELRYGLDQSTGDPWQDDVRRTFAAYQVARAEDDRTRFLLRHRLMRLLQEFVQDLDVQRPLPEYIGRWQAAIMAMKALMRDS